MLSSMRLRPRSQGYPRASFDAATRIKEGSHPNAPRLRNCGAIDWSGQPEAKAPQTVVRSKGWLRQIVALAKKLGRWVPPKI